MEYNKRIIKNWRNCPLRKINDAIDRFCAMHPRWGIPGLMRYIVGANAVVYILSLFDGSGTLLSFLSMNAYSVLHGELWRIVTFVLIPSSGGFWLVISLFFYYWLGESLERAWGSAKFTVYYLSGMLLTVLACILAYFIDGLAVSIRGAGYVNSALFLAYALMDPEAMVRIYFIIPIKMKWLAILEGVLYAAHFVRYAIGGFWGVALLPVVALLNLAVFFSPDFYQKASQIKYRTRPQAVQFRRAVKGQQQHKGYNHKCAVCGRTDTDHPGLQFRYCSKCVGYHCFCEDHIFNHTHFTQ